VPGPSPEIFRQLLAADPDYWRRLVPDFHIGDERATLEYTPVDAAAIDAAVQAIERDGTFRLPSVLSPGDVRRLNAALDAVVGAGWPTIFTFIYDEYWLTARAPATRAALEAVLGPGFVMTPRMWTHVVDPVDGAKGWAPHVDGESRARMNTWIALSEATVANGCMHVLPRGAVPAELAERFHADGAFTANEMGAMLHGVRALPASPGDLLGWAYDVIHWGGRVTAPGPTRRSISIEYAAATDVPGEHERPFVPLTSTPAFADRLRFIARLVISYRRFEPALARFDALARELLRTAPAPFRN
jgi:hypothetical protein